MDIEQEYSQNRVLLKKIKKQSTLISIMYILYSLMGVFALFSAILLASPLMGIVTVMVITAAGLGLVGVSRKDNRFVVASLVIIIVQFFMFVIAIGDLLMSLLFSGPGYAVVVVFVYFAIRNNNQYHWLEEQQGFPNFEVKQTMYEMEKTQRKIKDPYAIRMEEFQKRTENTGQMEEL